MYSRQEIKSSDQVCLECVMFVTRLMAAASLRRWVLLLTEQPQAGILSVGHPSLQPSLHKSQPRLESESGTAMGRC